MIMPRMSIEEFEEKMLLHLQRFVEEVNASDDSTEVFYEDSWWERFSEFSQDLNENE